MTDNVLQNSTQKSKGWESVISQGYRSFNSERFGTSIVYYWNLQILNHVIIIKTKLPLPQA